MRKSLALIFIINIILTLFQMSFFHVLFGNITPNLVLAFAFAVMFVFKSEYRFLAGFVGGICLDLFGFGTFGLTSVIILLALLLSFGVKKLIISQTYINLFWFLVHLSLYDMVLLGEGMTFMESFWRAIITSFISFLMYLLALSVIRRFNQDAYFLDL